MATNSTHTFSSSRAAGVIALLVTTIAVNLAASAPAAAATGPYLVMDINSSGSSNPSELTDVNGTLMFAAKGGAKGNELWRSDGTAVGTWRVKDINPGGGGSNPTYLTAIGGLLYFSASDGLSGHELWASDGTTAGTRLVKDINPGSNDSGPYGFTPFKGSVYFSAEDAATGRELWRTDGTAAGTKRVKDIRAGTFGSYPVVVGVLADKLYFTADPGGGTTRLYRTDGTSAGTKPMRDATGDIVGGQYVVGGAIVGSRLFFNVDDTELWRSTGKQAGTRMIANVAAYPIVGVGDTAFFNAYPDLWKSDGTKAGTVMVGAIDGVAQFMTDLGGTLILFPQSIDGLWRSDGTGVELVYDILIGDGLAIVGSSIYFDGFTPEEWDNCSCMGEPPQRLWRSDGSSNGTYSVTPHIGQIEQVTAVGDAIFFVSDADGHGHELWRYVP